VKVVVVGAGPAGCAAAFRLHREGREVLLLDAEDRVGGRTWTLRDGGYVIDTGAFYVANLYRATLALLEELGRRDELVPMQRRSGLVDGDERWTWKMGSASGLLRARGVPARQRVEAMARLARLAMRRVDAFALDELARRDDGATVADWARSTLGAAVHERVVRPSFDPYWLFPTERAVASLFTSFARDAAGLQLLAFPQGTDSLCRWLAEDVPQRLGARALAVTAGESGVEVQLADERLEADAAVVATDAHVAAKLLGPLAAALGGVSYAAGTHVSLCFEEDRWRACPATTHPARPTEHDVGTVSLLSHKLASLVPAGHEVIDVYLSDAASRRLSEHEAVATAIATAGRWLGVPLPTPRRVHVFARERCVMLPAPGHYARVQSVRDALPAQLALAGDYHSAGIIEGAVRSGLDAAARVGAAGRRRSAVAS
jgi:oxygen-dependent protoporphyrinogen oxidase